jgi:hypothetical protein
MLSAHIAAGHQRLAALLIGGTAAIEVVLVTHHPVAPRVGPGGNPFDSIRAVVETNLAFHAVLMMILAGQLLGLLLFSRRLGLGRPIVCAGLIFCGLASVLLVVAMTFDGFVTYELISACSASAEGCTGSTGEGLRVILAAIQAFTKLGFAAQCLGFAALGAAMWAFGRRIRLAAVLCVGAALAPIVLIVAGGRVGPAQLVQVLGLFAGWGLCVALVLVCGALVERNEAPRSI